MPVFSRSSTVHRAFASAIALLVPRATDSSMMHILASHYRSEFLACPQLVRLDFVIKGDRFEPALLIKANTLLLKYIVTGVRLQFALARVDDRLLYGLRVYDDPRKPGLLWSVLEREEEKSALAALVRGGSCDTFLFDEIALNVASSVTAIEFADADVIGLVESVATAPADHDALRVSASAILDQMQSQTTSGSGVILAEIPRSAEWNRIHNTLRTNRASSSLIDLFDTNEGDQQEQIGVWLIDSLHPKGAYHSPQIPKGEQTRELTDILLTHESSSFLIESKALSIFARASLPDRAKLRSVVTKNVAKAVSQLRGGIRKLKAGVSVTTPAGDSIEVNRANPSHGIVLIPDLELIEEPQAYEIEFIRDYANATGGIPHLLDPSELLRVVQAAEMIAARGKAITPMVAFDFYLMERFKKAIEAGTLCFEMRLHIAD
jgi:hypothetical protein